MSFFILDFNIQTCGRYQYLEKSQLIFHKVIFQSSGVWLILTLFKKIKNGLDINPLFYQ